MSIILGYLIIIACVLGGFGLAGGHFKAILQPIELMIIAGAALGSFVVGNSGSVLKKVAKTIPSLFRGKGNIRNTYVDLLSLMYQLLNKGRQQGLMSLEADIDAPQDSPIFKNYPKLLNNHHVIDFICDYFRLIITSNMQPFQLEALMDSEMESLQEEAQIPANSLTKLGDAMPAFGIVAAVLGVVHTMESIDLPPAQLGVLVAQALVGTFLGILLGYGFISPLASLLEQRNEQEHLMLACVKVTILASLHNNPPIIAVEFGRKVLFSEHRPSFNELNDEIKNAGRSVQASETPTEAASGETTEAQTS